MGRVDEARALVGPLLDQEAAKRGLDEFPTFELAGLLELAVLLEHHEAAASLVSRLACAAHVAIGAWFYTGVARHLGDGCALLGEHDQARAYYEQSLVAAGRIGFRPELAMTHVALAELLLNGGPAEYHVRSVKTGFQPSRTGYARQGRENLPAEALRHLELAIPELSAMGMRPALERARQIAARAEETGGSAERTTLPNGLSEREAEVLRLLAQAGAIRRSPTSW